MTNPYGEIMRVPGALRFTIAAALARFPMAVLGLSLLLAISELYEEYSIAGTANAILVICFSLVNPFYARLVDRRGQTRILFPLITVNLACIIGLLVVILTRQESPWIFLLSALTGLSSCSFGAYVRARWTYVLSNSAQLNTAFAWESAIDEVIYICGPILATALITSVHVGSGLICSILCVAVGGYWMLTQKRTEPPPMKNPINAKQRNLLSNGAMLTLCTIFVFCGFVYGGLDLTVIAFCRELKQETLAGIILATMGVASFIGAIIYGARKWPLSPLRLFSGGILLLAFSFTTLLIAGNIPLMFLAMVFTGIFYAPTMTNANNLLQRIVPAERFTEGLAWFTTSFTLGISGGAAIAGYVIDEWNSWGGRVLVVIEGWLMLVIVIAGLLPLRNSLRRNQKPGSDENCPPLEIVEYCPEPETKN